METEHGTQGEDQEPTAQDAPGSASQPARDLKAWATSNALHRASSRLAAMPPGNALGTVQVPFPHPVTREEYKALTKGAGIPARAKEIDPTEVPLDDLSAFQGSVNAERVSQYVDDPDLIPEGKRAVHTGMPTDYPVLVRKGGRLYIHDGNHRATAAKLRGEATILARVVDLDASK